MKKLKLFLSLLMLFTFSIGNMWATDQLAYTIELQPTSSSTSARTTVNFISTMVTAGNSYIDTCTATAIAYPDDNCIKLGSSNKAGSFTLTLSNSGQVKATKVVLSAKYYDSDKTIKLTVNSKDSTFTPTKNFADYALNLDGKTTITSISVASVTASKGRMYVDAIKVYTASAEPTLTLTPKTLDFETVYKGETIDAMTFNVKGANLTKGLKLLAPAGYTLSTDTITKAEAEANAGKDITVTPVTTTAGTFNGNITVGGAFSDFGGEKDSVVAVSMEVKERVWTPDGANHDFGTILMYGDKPEAYTFTLKGTHLTPGSEIILQNSIGTDYYDFTPDYATVDENGNIDEQITISLKYTNVPSTMTNNVVVRSNGGVDPVEYSLFTVTTAVTVRYTIEATTDEHGNTFTWTDPAENANPQYGTPGETITATPKPAAGYVFTADSWDIYNKNEESVKVENTAGAFTMPNHDVVISGAFENSGVKEIVTSETELDYGTVDINSDAVEKTFTITGANLTEGITLSVGNHNHAFSLSKTSFTKEEVMAAGGVEVTVTSDPYMAGDCASKVQIEWEDGYKYVDLKMTVNKLAAGLAWSAAAATVTKGEATADDFPTLTNPNSLAITYSSTNTDAATINAETGAITLVAAGTTTIKATTEGDGTYAAQEVSYTLTVQEKKTVEWWINGAKKGSQTALEGTELTGIPDATLASNGAIYGKVFKGWAEAEIEEEVAEGDAGIVATPSVMPNEDKKYYAVYATEVPGTKTTKTDTLDYAFTGLGTSSSYKEWSGKTGKSGAIYAGQSNALGNSATTFYIQMRNQSPSGIVTTTTGTGKVSEVRIKWNSSTANDRYVTIFGKNTTAYEGSADLYADDKKGSSLGTIKKGTSTKLTISSSYDYIGLLASAAIYMDTIEIDWTETSATTYSKYATSGPKLLPDPTFSPIAGTYTEAKSVAISAGEGETIYYTINGEDPTTSSDEYTTAISLSKYGEYTIKAIAAKEDGSKSNVASATYKIEVPFASVSELLTYLSENSLTTLNDITVTGLISSVESYSGTYKSITYWISDDGKESTLQIYSGKGLESADFSSKDDLHVGDKVSVKGDYLYYNSTKHEINYDNYLVEYTEAEVSSIEIGGDADTKAYENGEAFAFTGLTATAVYNTGYEKDVTEEANVWAADPATIGASTESVSVTATYDEVASTPKVVTGITVKKHSVTFEAPANGTLVVKKNNGEEWVAITSGDTFVKGTTLKVEATPVSDDYKLTALTAGGADILEAGQFTVGTENITVVATISEKAEAPISWNRATVTAYTVAKDWMSALFSNEQGLTVTFTSTATDVATVDANGEATPLKTGETTIKAIFAGNNDYKAKTVSYTMNVYEPVSIALGGELEKTEYESGEEFDRTGLTAALKYDDDETSNVTGLADWLIDGEASAIVSDDGQFSVKVSYEGFSDTKLFDVTVKTHAVTFADPANGSLVVKNGDDEITSGDAFVKGTTLTVVATPNYGYELATLTAGGVDIKASKEFTVDETAVAVAATFTELPIKFYVAGDFTSWDTYKVASYEDSYTIKNLAAGDHMMKIVDGENWYGYDKLSAKTGEFTRGSGTDDNNIKFTLAEAGDVVVTYTGEVFTVEGNFLMPTIQIAGSWTTGEWGEDLRTLTPAEDKLTASVTLNLTQNYYEFKMVVNTVWVSRNGNDGKYELNRGWTSVDGLEGNKDNIVIRPDVEGDYIFTWTYATGTLTVTFPDEPATEYYIAGTFTNWKTNMVKMTENLGAFEKTITINSTENQEFKVVRVKGLNETWYGLESDATMTSDDCENWIIGGGDKNIGLEPTKAGDYKFVFVPAELKLTLTMPAKSGTALGNTADETKAVKFLENGQIFILRGDKVYTADGQLVK